MKISKFIAVFILLFSLSFVFAEDTVVETKNMRLTLNPDNGSFCIYRKNKISGNFQPLLDDGSYTSATGFYLKSGDNVRKLEKGLGVNAYAYPVDNGAVLSFNVADEAFVAIQFLVLSSVSADNDSIRVDITVQNTGTESEKFAVKALFDTMLGESTKTHFSTKFTNRINSEIGFESMETEKWIRSTDGIQSIQFLLDGEYVSSPQLVSMANKEYLLSGTWLHKVSSGRKFDSIRSYNNSALGIYWNEVQLPALAKSNFSFYITTGAGGSVPPDLQSITEESLAFVQTIVKKAENSFTDENGISYELGPITAEQLNPEYLNDLLTRIQLVESGASSVTLAEVQMLNLELDAILRKMGRVKQ